MLNFGAARGVQNGTKINKNLIKNRVDFCNDFECLFFRSWVAFGSENLSKMRYFGVTFSTSLRVYEKCDFEQPSNGFAIFFDFKRVDFQPQKLYFSGAFSKMLLRRPFSRFWVENWTKLDAKWEPKSI